MPAADLQRYPWIVIWETTRACQLACRHCRARAVRRRHPGELTTAEARNLVDQLVDLARPLFVLTGGDPMERDDLVEICAYACRRGLSVSVTPSATDKVTPDRLRALRDAGVDHLAFSLDGSQADVHDRFRGVRGTFARTLAAAAEARALGFTLQINTTVSRFNLHDLPNIPARVQELGAARWGVFFQIPVGRARAEECLRAEEYFEVLRWLQLAAENWPFDVKTTEGPHARLPLFRPPARPDRADVRSPLPIWDGNGFLFVAHTGEVYPSGFLPVAVGNVREQPIAQIYRQSPVLRSLRDPARFSGPCGTCPWNRLCGGSRARAWAAGDYLGTDPYCAQGPPAA